jgi:hypothetical protein
VGGGGACGSTLPREGFAHFVTSSPPKSLRAGMQARDAFIMNLYLLFPWPLCPPAPPKHLRQANHQNTSKHYAALPIIKALRSNITKHASLNEEKIRKKSALLCFPLRFSHMYSCHYSRLRIDDRMVAAKDTISLRS